MHIKIPFLPWHGGILYDMCNQLHWPLSCASQRPACTHKTMQCMHLYCTYRADKPAPPTPLTHTPLPPPTPSYPSCRTSQIAIYYLPQFPSSPHSLHLLSISHLHLQSVIEDFFQRLTQPSQLLLGELKVLVLFKELQNRHQVFAIEQDRLTIYCAKLQLP